MSDCFLLFDYFRSHPEWNNTIDIQLNLKPNAVNWAMRSRISDMNRFWLKKHKLDFFIESRLGKNGCAEYRLVKIDKRRNANEPYGSGISGHKSWCQLFDGNQVFEEIK